MPHGLIVQLQVLPKRPAVVGLPLVGYRPRGRQLQPSSDGLLGLPRGLYCCKVDWLQLIRADGCIGGSFGEDGPEVLPFGVGGKQFLDAVSFGGVVEREVAGVQTRQFLRSQLTAIFLLDLIMLDESIIDECVVEPALVDPVGPPSELIEKATALLRLFHAIQLLIPDHPTQHSGTTGKHLCWTVMLGIGKGDLCIVCMELNQEYRFVLQREECRGVGGFMVTQKMIDSGQRGKNWRAVLPCFLLPRLYKTITYYAPSLANEYFHLKDKSNALNNNPATTLDIPLNPSALCLSLLQFNQQLRKMHNPMNLIILIPQNNIFGIELVLLRYFATSCPNASIPPPFCLPFKLHLPQLDPALERLSVISPQKRRRLENPRPFPNAAGSSHPGKVALSDSSPAQTHIARTIHREYKYNQLDHLTHKMFYFVFPNSLTLNSYSWILPFAETQPASLPQEKLQNCQEVKFSVVDTIILSPLPTECPSSSECPLKSLPAKSPSPSKRLQCDDDYKPLCANNKRVKKSRQMQNRNVVPNIIRLILSYIQKKEKSQKLVELLMGKLRQDAGNICSKRYYLFQKLVRGKINNYVNEDTLKELYKLRPEEFQVYPWAEQVAYNRITRILISEFMREDIVTCILTSKRMEASKKRNHLEAARVLKSKLHQLLLQ